MKKISNDEFKEYMEYKKFMNGNAAAQTKGEDEPMSFDELDAVTAARGNEDFESFMQKIREMDQKDGKE